MTLPNDEPNTAGAAPDRLLQRYREANALDEERPAPGLRDAVLAQARAQANQNTRPITFAQRPTAAANDRTWTLRALGTLAVLGLVGLLVLQFDQGTSDEREIAFGAPPSPSAPSAARAPAPADIASAPATAEPPPVPRTPAPETRTEAAPARPAPVGPPRSESALKPTPDLNEAAPAPIEAPADRLESRAPEPSADFSAPDAAASRSRAAPAPMTAQPPPAHSAEAARPAWQAAPESLPLPALLRAAQSGDLASAREAIARGDDLNATNADGRTALMTAAARGDLALVRLLLDAGADTARTDPNGLTAADLARQAGHGQVLDLL